MDLGPNLILTRILMVSGDRDSTGTSWSRKKDVIWYYSHRERGRVKPASGINEHVI